MLGATRNAGERCAGQSISIHAPLCGGRLLPYSLPWLQGDFNPRPPVRGATLCRRIHCACIDISIHAPLCGGRHAVNSKAHCRTHFNPRPPVRGATMRICSRYALCLFQSTPPCAGGDLWLIVHKLTICGISIHAPLCGGRLFKFAFIDASAIFQSTPPCAGGDLKYRRTRH